MSSVEAAHLSTTAAATSENALPEGWTLSLLGECVEILDSRRVPINSDERAKRQGQVPYYGATGQVGWIDDYLFNEELLLLGEDGAPFLDKSQPISYIISGKSWVNNHAHVLRAVEALTSNRFVKFWLDAFDFSEYVTGSTRLKLTQTAMTSIPIAIPPLCEQYRIVQKVEDLLRYVSAARDHLSQVPAILKRFRQAVLAAACSGKLTEEWRSAFCGPESVERLIETVLAERKSAWGRGHYRAPAEIDGDELPEIPEQWRYVSFDTFVSDSFYGPRFGSDDYSSQGVPTIRTTDIRFDGRLELHDPPRIQLGSEQLRDFALEDEDLLVTRTGATIGKVALYHKELGTAIPSAYLIRFRLTRKALSARYLLMFMMSPRGQQLLLGGSTAVAQPNVNARNICRFPVPLPPRSETVEIISRVEALLGIASAVEQRLVKAAASAERLAQSILAKAFRGELVPTEAELARREGRDYEPASVLLERIREERADKARTPPPSKRSVRKASAHV